VSSALRIHIQLVVHVILLFAITINRTTQYVNIANHIKHHLIFSLVLVYFLNSCDDFYFKNTLVTVLYCIIQIQNIYTFVCVTVYYQLKNNLEIPCVPNNMPSVFSLFMLKYFISVSIKICYLGTCN